MYRRLRRKLSISTPEWVPLIGVLLLSLIVRVVNLGAESAWIDEGYSLALARYSVIEIIRGTASDQHPPLYYLLLHVWQALGSSVFNARMLSVLLGVLNVYQIQVLGRKLGGMWLALGASLLLAINPMHVWYSQEARQYMLLAVLTTAATIEYWECLHGKRRWVIYGLFSLLALYTQYFAVFVLFSHFCLAIIWTVWQRNKRILLQWFVTILGVGLFFLPWLPVTLNQFLYHPTPWIDVPVSGEIRDVLQRLLLGSGILILPDALRWLSLIGITGVLIWVGCRIITRRENATAPIFFLAMSVVVPYVVISAISFIYPIFQFKQFLILLVPTLLLAVMITGLFPRPWKTLAYVCLLVTPIFSLVYQQVTLSKDDWRGLSEYIQANAQIGDVLFSNPSAASLTLNLYLDSDIPIKGYPPDYDILTGGWQGEVVNHEIANRELIELGSTTERLWLVEFFPEFWDPDGYFPESLESNAEKLDEQWFGNIHLRLYDFGQADP